MPNIRPRPITPPAPPLSLPFPMMTSKTSIREKREKEAEEDEREEDQETRARTVINMINISVGFRVYTLGRGGPGQEIPGISTAIIK